MYISFNVGMDSHHHVPVFSHRLDLMDMDNGHGRYGALIKAMKSIQPMFASELM